MTFTTQRQVGGSVMLAIPPDLLKTLRLQPGAKVGIAIEGGRLVVVPQSRYTLDELLTECNPKAARTREDREWLRNKPASAELI